MKARFIIQLLLAFLFLIPVNGLIGNGLSETLQFLTDIPDIIVEVGVAIVMLILSYFLSGRIIGFAMYALGGGIARYNTTKLYRRWQLWVLIFHLSFIISAVLFFAVSTAADDSVGGAFFIPLIVIFISLALFFFMDFRDLQNEHGWSVPDDFVNDLETFRDNTKASIGEFYTRVVRFLDQGRFGKGGAARFTSLFEEWTKPHAVNDKSLYMGRSLFNPNQEIGLGGEGHMLTIAGSRGGKGSSVIIPNLLEWQGSAVVIDPKGTNARVTANARRKMGQKVHIIDPMGIVTEDSARFNPLLNLDSEDPLFREYVTAISDALVYIPPDAKDPHWDEGAKSVISGLIAHLVSCVGTDWMIGASGEASQPSSPTLPEIRDLISQLPEDMKKLWADMAMNEGAGGLPRDVANRVIRGLETSEMLNILSNVEKHTEWLASPVMKGILSDHTFELKDICAEPTTVYLVIPPRAVKRHRRLIRLFVNLVIETVERGGKSPVPILMMIDEFLGLGRMDEFPEAFQTMASYNLTLWPFVQDIGAMQEIYGKDFNTFEASARAIQVFSVADKETREFISEKLGKAPLRDLGDISRSNEAVEIRSASDVEKDVAPDTLRQYIIERGKPPMVIERVPYYESKRLKDRYDPDPDYAS